MEWFYSVIQAAFSFIFVLVVIGGSVLTAVVVSDLLGISALLVALVMAIAFIVFVVAIKRGES